MHKKRSQTSLWWRLNRVTGFGISNCGYPRFTKKTSRRLRLGHLNTFVLAGVLMLIMMKAPYCIFFCVTLIFPCGFGLEAVFTITISGTIIRWCMGIIYGLYRGI